MSPVEYAKKQIAAGRFPDMPIYEVAEQFHLCDRNWRMLTGRSYTTRTEAERDRSKILDRANRYIDRK